MFKLRFSWSLTIFLFFVVEIIVFSLISPNFINLGNLLSMTNNFMDIGIVALGMTFVIMGGGIDLSVGSIMSLSGVMMGIFWQHGLNIWLAGILAVLVGGVCGWINGQLITRTGIQPLIATLATLFIYGSIALVISGDGSIYGFPKDFSLLGNGFLFGIIPIQLCLYVILAAFFSLLLHKSIYGRIITFIGNNENAVSYSGIHVNKMKAWTYTVSGLTAGISSVVLGSYFASVRGDMGQNFELTVITACLLGGVNVFGGAGSMFGVIVGTFILGVLGQGLKLLSVSTVEQSIITGIILILAVGIQQASGLISRHRRFKLAEKRAANQSIESIDSVAR